MGAPHCHRGHSLERRPFPVGQHLQMVQQPRSGSAAADLREVPGQRLARAPEPLAPPPPRAQQRPLEPRPDCPPLGWPPPASPSQRPCPCPCPPCPPCPSRER